MKEEKPTSLTTTILLTASLTVLVMILVHKVESLEKRVEKLEQSRPTPK